MNQIVFVLCEEDEGSKEFVFCLKDKRILYLKVQFCNCV